jgi:sporulation protein YlmC with PRC-barrel domain
MRPAFQAWRTKVKRLAAMTILALVLGARGGAQEAEPITVVPPAGRAAEGGEDGPGAADALPAPARRPGLDAGWRGKREALAAPRLERQGYAPAMVFDVPVDLIVGTEVYDTNDEAIGSVSDVVVDDNDDPEFAVVTIGGFLGIGARTVAFGFDEMQVLRTQSEIRIYVDVTEEMVDALPEYGEN